MRTTLFCFLLLPLITSADPSDPSDPIDQVNETTKTARIRYDDPSKDAEYRRTLVTIAKKKVADELFGELISSLTEVRNGALTRDLIVAKTLGRLRVRGTPQFFRDHGANHLVVSLTGYVTEDDRIKARPITLRGTKHYPSEGRTYRELVDHAKKMVILELLYDEQPRLKSVQNKQLLLELVRKRQFNGGMIGDIGYEMVFSGEVIPIELELFGNPVQKVAFEIENPQDRTEKSIADFVVKLDNIENLNDYLKCFDFSSGRINYYNDDSASLADVRESRASFFDGNSNRYFMPIGEPHIFNEDSDSNIKVFYTAQFSYNQDEGGSKREGLVTREFRIRRINGNLRISSISEIVSVRNPREYFVPNSFPVKAISYLPESGRGSFATTNDAGRLQVWDTPVTRHPNLRFVLYDGMPGYVNVGGSKQAKPSRQVRRPFLELIERIRNNRD